jgi:hypothetical protein
MLVEDRDLKFLDILNRLKKRKKVGRNWEEVGEKYLFWAAKELILLQEMKDGTFKRLILCVRLFLNE